MAQVCNVKMRVWQRKDSKWSGEARLSGPGDRRTKIVHTGYLTRLHVEDVINGDVNELLNGFGWERRDVEGDGGA